jgi:hypothetical protein
MNDAPLPLPQTVAGFAKDIGMTRQALYKHIAAGRLKARKVGRFTVVEPADAATFKARLRSIRYGDRIQTVLST